MHDRSVFHESREDLAVVVGPAGRQDVVHTHADGLCLDDAIEPALLAFRSSGCSDEPLVLMQGTRALALQATLRPDSRTCELDAESTLAAAERLQALAEDALGAARFTVRWVSFLQRVSVARDTGFAVEDRRAGWRVRLEGRIDQGARRTVAAVELGRGSPPAPDDARLPGLARSVAARLLERKEAAPAPSGPTQVVLAAGVGGVLAHEIFGHALEADVYMDGGSWLQDLPHGVLPEGLVVIDDPRLCRAPIRVDDEGSESRAIELVANGRIVSCLHDRSTASRLGVPCTGHGRRASFRDPTRPRMACTYIGQGKIAAQELLPGVTDGIFVRRMEAGFTDTRSGRCTFRVTDADRIHNGAIDVAIEPHVLEIEARRAIPSLRIADDLVFDTCIGSCHRDGQTLITSVGAPTLCVGLGVVVR